MSPPPIHPRVPVPQVIRLSSAVRTDADRRTESGNRRWSIALAALAGWAVVATAGWWHSAENAGQSVEARAVEQRQVEALRGAITELNDDMDGLAARLRLYDRVASTARHRAALIKNDLAAAESRSSALEGEVASALATAGEIEAAAAAREESHQDELVALEWRADAMAAEMEIESGKRERELRAVAAAADAAAEEAERNLTVAQAAESRAALAAGEVQALENELASVCAARDHLAREAEALRGRVAQLESERNALVAIVNDLKCEVGRLRAALATGGHHHHTASRPSP